MARFCEKSSQYRFVIFPEFAQTIMLTLYYEIEPTSRNIDNSLFCIAVSAARP